MRRLLVLALVVTAALAAAPPGSAKGRYWIDIADTTPRVGQSVTVTLRSSWTPKHNLRLFAIAPGKKWFEVVGVITGDSPGSNAVIPRDGFRVRLVRVGPRRWRGVVKFPRPGRWVLVEPCGCESGISTAQVKLLVDVSAKPVAPPALDGPMGAEGCAPPSPARPWAPPSTALVEARGTSGDHELWGLVFGGLWASSTATIFTRDPAKEFKIVWRMTGTGPLRLVATAPSGATTGPVREPTPHGSNWNRPGDEWGSSFLLPEDGCWRIRASRDSGYGDLWIVVRRAS